MSEPRATPEAPQKLIGRIRAGGREFAQILRSGPLGRRLLAVIGLGLMLSSVGLTGWGLKRLASPDKLGYRGKKGAEEECKELKCTLNALEVHIKKQEELASVRDASVGLGEFDVELVGLGAGQSSVIVELDVTVQLDSAETGRWLTANLEPVRSLVLQGIATIAHLTRADLMTAEGKAVVRDRVRERVSQALPSGKVKDVFFNKYVLK